MPKDTKTRYPGVYARHRQGCAIERERLCNCRPSYWGKAWDSAAGKHRKTKFLSTVAAARNARADLERTIREGRQPIARSPRVRDAIETFLTAARARSALNKNGRPYKPSAIRTLSGALDGPVADAIGAKRLGKVRKRDVQRIVDALAPQKSGSTVRRVVNSIRSLYTWAHDREYVDHDPAHRVRLPPVDAVPRDRVATPEEMTRLLAVLPIEDALPYALAAYATARRGEIRHVLLDDVDLKQLILYLGSDENARKSRAAQRPAPIVRPFAAILRRAQLARDPAAGNLLCPGRKPGGRNSGRLSCEALQARADKAWDKAGLQRITLHECRHTAISWLDAAGVRHQVISTIAGHTLKHGGAQVTARYTHTLPGDLEDARRLLDAYLAREEHRKVRASRAQRI
jgi:integrase